MEAKKELKYPIKYAVMPIVERVGWTIGLNELERDYGVVANIASKCYVVGVQKKYLSDGTIKTEYEVVFPYANQDKIYNDGLKRVTPMFSLYSKCINSVVANALYNSFEEALETATKANEEILRKQIGILPFDKDFKENCNAIKEEHQKNIGRYKKIEEQIEKETTDMLITRNPESELSDIIEQIIENPREFYIKLESVLTVEEREYLKQLIENRSCLNCTNGSCRVEQCEKVGLDDEGKPQGSNCLSWNNPELIGRQRILRKE